MYTEIKELVNYLAKYLYSKSVPRRKVGLFTEQLANQLLKRYRQTHWNINEPKQDEAKRVLQLQQNIAVQDPAVVEATATVGLDLEEVVFALPSFMTVFANPGEVYFRVGEKGAVVPIWMGSPLADDHFESRVLSTLVVPGSSNLGVAGKTVMLERQIDDSIRDFFVPLKLEVPYGSKDGLKEFVYTTGNMTVTVEQFAATRFGSQRLRPDHEMLKRIQKAAGRHQQGQLNFPMPPSEHLCTLTTAQRRELLDFLRSFPDTDSAARRLMELWAKQEQPSFFYDPFAGGDAPYGGGPSFGGPSYGGSASFSGGAPFNGGAPFGGGY